MSENPFHLPHCVSLRNLFRSHLERSRSNEAYAPPLLGTAGCCARGCGTFFFSKPQHLAHQQQSTPPMVPPTMAATMST